MSTILRVKHEFLLAKHFQFIVYSPTYILVSKTPLSFPLDFW